MGFYWGVTVEGEKRYEPNTDRGPDTGEIQWLAPATKDDGGVDLVPVPLARGHKPVSLHKLRA
jgi:hypothetical protein